MSDNLTTAAAIRRFMPWAILAIALSIVRWFHFAESAFRFYAYVFAPLGAAIGLWFWYVNGQAPERRARLRKRTLIGAGIGIALFVILFRFDGSYRGTSLIKFTWRWTPKDAASLRPVPIPIPVPVTQERVGEVTGLLLDWPQYLGPDRDGMVKGIELETDWTAHPPKLLWTIAVGPGWGSFAVRGRNAVTIEQREDEELVTCYDAISGQLVWSHADPGKFEGPMGGPGPRSTPTLADGKVYTQGATGVLNCLDEETGKVIWTRQVLQDLGSENLKYGKSNSPLVTGNLVIVSGGETSGPVMAAYDKETGEPVWKGPEGKASYTSPSLAKLGGREQILYVGSEAVMGLDPATGAGIWAWPWKLTWPKVAQPLAVDDSHVLISASYGQGCHLLDVSQSPPTPLWKSTRMKAKFSNLVVNGDYAYGLDEGDLACLDLMDGARVWKEGSYGFGQNLLVGDTLLIQAEDGALALVAATPDGYRELSKLKVFDSVTWNVPALAGSYLLVRNDREARCYQLALRP